MTMEQVLQAIKQECGMSALRDGDALVGLFRDFSRNQLRPQANALKVFVNCQGNTRILNLKNAASQEQQVQLHRLVQEMSTQHNMREETAVEVCSAFWQAAIGTEYPVSAAFGMTAEEMYQRGKQYEYDSGMEKQQRLLKAIEWYEKAAKQNHLGAQKELGLIYQLNTIEGNPVDSRKSAFWYQKAAEQGDAEAQANLATYLCDGRHVEHNYEQAKYWGHKAAEQNNLLAMFTLSFLYEKHLNNPKLSFDWCRKGAELGDCICQKRLGTMYEDGFGTVIDYEKALYWYRKAAQQGDKSAADRIPEVEKRLAKKTPHPVPDPVPTPPAPKPKHGLSRGKKLVLLVLAVFLALVVLSFVTGGDPGKRTRSDLKLYNLEDSIEDMLLAGTEEIYTYPDGTWMEFYYDDAGKEIYRVYVNTENEIEYLFEARYDSSGRLVYHQSFDGEGNLMRTDSYDFHSGEDTAQRRVTLANGRYFQGISAFDENGYETFTVTHEDGTKTVYVYKDGGVLTRRVNYDAEGNSPEVTSDAMQIGIDWENTSKVYGPRQKVIGWTNSNGYTRSYVQGLCGGAMKEYSISIDSAFIETYDPTGNLLEQLYYRDGQMNELGSHAVHTYDSLGNYTGYTETFYTSVGDGNYTFTVYDENGIELSMESHFFDGDEEIISYFRYETELDDQGREICVQTFDGETGRLISVDETEYDKAGNDVKTIRTYYHEDGNYNITVRDGEGHITSDITYYPSGSVRTENAYNSEGQHIKSTQYYESGQVTSITEYNGQGDALSRIRYYESGQTQYLDEYDAQGNLTRSTSYYENGKVDNLTEYNNQGDIRKMVSYYENGQIRYLFEYNDQGEIVKQVYYNEDGTVVD